MGLREHGPNFGSGCLKHVGVKRFKVKGPGFQGIGLGLVCFLHGMFQSAV